MKIPFSPPDIGDLEVEKVTEVLKSGWITTGAKTKELENKVASFCDVNRSVCLNSQTSCAEMALRILGIGEGDEVITSAYTYTATASVVHHVGAKLVLVDTKKDSIEMGYDKLEELINENTKVIIPVDIAGIPCDYEKVYSIVNKKKDLFKPKNKIQEKLGRIAINADAAHAFGASKNGKMVGSLADFSSFSFHAVKNVTTAEGGALTWNTIDGVSDEDIYRQIQLLSLHGQSKDALAKTTLGSWEYDIEGLWYKCNMTDILAAIGLAQMDRYSELLERRRDIIKKYNHEFEKVGIQFLPHISDSHESSGHLYITRIPNITVEERNEIIVKMAERGISCNVHYKPLPMFTAYKNLGFDIKDYPNAYDFYKNEITLPLHTKLSDEEIDYIIETYKDIVSEYM